MTSNAPATPHASTLRRGWGRLLRACGLVGLGLTAATAPAAPQAQVPQPVPQHWISYANLAGNQLQAALSDPANEAVVRLHAWMQARMLREGQVAPPAPLVVRLWVAADGRVRGVVFDPLGDVQADADLRALLTAQSLAEAPPRDMLQPMVLQLTLSFATGI
ncbi:YbaB/EbfC family DNA-binding protein [Variovorax sp. LT2P21]|uniref:YbaB/EbfC family DNA-binding protein n=1 Tax=Variovorax sp. LT2P21 TaxID=3443731 RepID=UPI003F47E143